MSRSQDHRQRPPQRLGPNTEATSDKGPLALLHAQSRVDHGSMYSDHHALELLSQEECIELLRSKTVGRLGLSASSLPFVLPVRYVVDRDRILMRTGQDTRMAAATSDAVVAFEVDEFDPTLDAGWSVLVQGFAREVRGGAEVDPDAEQVLRSWVGPMPARCFSIPMEVVTGQRLHPVGARRLGDGSSRAQREWSAATRLNG